MTSINTGTVTIDWKLRTRPRAGVVVGGRVKMGPHDCLVRPQDVELRTIKSLVVSPMGTSQYIGSYAGYRTTVIETYMGSVGVLDTSRAAGTPGGNYVRLRAARIGTMTSVGCQGTAVAGSLTASFLAFGE